MNVCDGEGGEDLFFISGNAALPEGREWQIAGQGPFQDLILGLLHLWGPLGASGTQQALVLGVGQLQT